MDDFNHFGDNSSRGRGNQRRGSRARGGGAHHQNGRNDHNRGGRGRNNYRSGQRSISTSRTDHQHPDRGRRSGDRPGNDHDNVRIRDRLRHSVERLDQPRSEFSQGPRPKRIMGFQFVQKLIENDDIQQVILELSNDRNGFDKLLDSKDMTNDMVVLLAKLLRNICSASFQESKITLLSAAIQSRFMEKLTVFVTGIMHQNSRDRRFNKKFWDDPDEFWLCLIKLSKTVQELIPTRCEPIKKLLKNMSVFIPMIEEEHSIHISDTIKAQTDSLLDVIDKTIKDLEVKKQRVHQHIPFEDVEPPNDFRDIEIIPSAEEVVSDLSPFLRENIIDRPFRDVQQYLDIQFRLLREDFVAPLRRGINTFLRNQGKPKSERKKLDDIRIYNPIRFLFVETLNECNCFRIKFDFTQKKKVFKYENSKKFMFGSLVCFTRDNFRSLLFGKIVQRDDKLLEQGMLIVGFQNEVEVSFEQDYLMVESSVYFEPYYHVLGVLKRMDPDTFPMERYIIRAETSNRLPQYLTNVMAYEVQGVRFLPLYMPPTRFYNFNDSQLAAFRAALSDEFVIIQGPPGTGKTYLGLKIAHVLLENRHAWYNKTPILVICYTNHALDQFLEGILPVTEQVLRIGGRSKNEALAKFNLAVKRRTVCQKAAAVHQKRREVRDYMGHVKTLSDTLDHIEANESVISFECFRGIIENYEKTWFARAKNDEITNWLLEGKSRDQQAIAERNNQREIEAGMQNLTTADANNEDEHPEDVDEDDPRNTEELDDVFRDIVIRGFRPLLTVKQLRDKLQRLNQEHEALSQEIQGLENILREENIAIEIWETQADLDYLLFQLNFYRDPHKRRRPIYTNLENPYSMQHADRWLLYYYWLDQYIRQLRQSYAEISDKFREVYRVYNEMRDMEDTQLMKEHLVVGLTTTGAARLQSSLQALKSPIVIVEEAAEVLEAHIVASLTNHCQHLILIGDHLQLKPGAADYRIETKYKLGISLFERMVRNNIKCHTLNVQHRMRPEISSLIKPHIYPDLQDHESTLHRPPILGVEKSLYFINHQVEEEKCEDASKKNIHESKFLIAFARHLILNGYKPEQITILAAYLGQYFEMVREKKRSNNAMLLQDVRISVLDNYQGEESDIILLSLVRSNPENKAGFLRIQNRVCVALSRARNGFYIIGNMSLLLKADSENQIWDKVKAVLEEQNAIGNHLTLRCQIHRYKYTQVSKAQDFVKLSEGGCDMLCGAAVTCGHTCRRLCHVQDRDHVLYKCNENCTRLLCDDLTHVCLKRCYEDCGPCMHLVSRYLDCGHTVRIECYIDPAKYSCMVRVKTKLPCDHEALKPCSADPEKFRCPFPCDTRVEPCGHACDRLCHIRMDPDHLKYMCRQPCAKPRRGCKQTDDLHLCTMLCCQDCEECNINVKKTRFCGHVFNVACKIAIDEQTCEKPCKKILSCGHKCRGTCSDNCPPCKYMVEKKIPDCQHIAKMECYQTPDRKLCKSKKCPRLLPCGHQCTRPCNAECTTECKEIVDCKLKSPCGHVVKRIMCYLKWTDDPDTLLRNCSEPCRTELKCKHKCGGTCGECMQFRIHKRCQEKCGVPLVCNHECPIPCREACKPCTLPCGIKCRHSKCKKKCGEPCTPCKNDCPRHCEHVKCPRKCGDICRVPPCSERCPKWLKCRHPCVGFCGDPCPPLCRICNEEELTEIFFGTEDDKDAVFVLLKDCNHVLESTGLQAWLDEGEDRIQFKTCPKCKTNIATTERYSDYIKRAVNDVILAKKKSFGEPEENDALRVALIEQLEQLKQSSFTLLGRGCPRLFTAIKTFSTRLEPSRNGRRQTIGKIELNAIQSKLQTLSYIIKCFSENKRLLDSTDQSSAQLNMLLDALMRSEDHVTNQEIEDLEFEIKRLHRIVQFEKIKRSSNFKYAVAQPGTATVVKNLEEIIFVKKRYTDVWDDAIKTQLKYLVSKVDSAMNISDQERMEIVKAMGLQKGHWYKCPNGHPYAIGECGGANQIAKCFCGERIGGTDHHLLPTNQFAGEMDGAARHAWPGGLY